MADFKSYERTNWFRVKDIEKFKEWGVKRQFDLRQDSEVPSMFSVLPGVHDTSFPDWDEKIEHEYDVLDEIYPHLQQDSICVLQCVGMEALSYLLGYSIAVNYKNERIQVDLDDIYKKAKETFNGEITLAEY